MQALPSTPSQQQLSTFTCYISYGAVMKMEAVHSTAVSEAESFTTFDNSRPATPETLVDKTPGVTVSSSTPWPGETFIINCSDSSGMVLTLQEGAVKLARPGDYHGSIHWNCVEDKGWLGFRNPVSGKFLGHDEDENLSCSADHHKFWEWFCVRMKPNGTYVLLMRGWDEELWPVVLLDSKLAKVKQAAQTGMSWKFVKV